MKIRSWETAYKWWSNQKKAEGQTFVNHKKSELSDALIAAGNELESLRLKYEGQDFQIVDYYYDSSSLLRICWCRDFTYDEKKNIAEAKKKYKSDALENEKKAVKKRAKQLGLL